MSSSCRSTSCQSLSYPSMSSLYRSTSSRSLSNRLVSDRPAPPPSQTQGTAPEKRVRWRRSQRREAREAKPRRRDGGSQSVPREDVDEHADDESREADEHEIVLVLEDHAPDRREAD